MQIYTKDFHQNWSSLKSHFSTHSWSYHGLRLACWSCSIPVHSRRKWYIYIYIQNLCRKFWNKVAIWEIWVKLEDSREKVFVYVLCVLCMLWVCCVLYMLCAVCFPLYVYAWAVVFCAVWVLCACVACAQRRDTLHSHKLLDKDESEYLLWTLVYN